PSVFVHSCSIVRSPRPLYSEICPCRPCPRNMSATYHRRLYRSIGHITLQLPRRNRPDSPMSSASRRANLFHLLQDPCPRNHGPGHYSVFVPTAGQCSITQPERDPRIPSEPIDSRSYNPGRCRRYSLALRPTKAAPSRYGAEMSYRSQPNFSIDKG